MFSQSFQKEMNKLKKEWEMRSWKYDIQSYHNTKKIREIAKQAGRDTTWYDNRMKEIRNRWPNVKHWD
jgi:hypothetical protein